MLMISYVYGFYLILRTAGAGDLPSAWLVTWISVFIIWNLVTALFHIKVLTYRRLLYIKSLSISAMVAPFSLGIAMSGWRNALKNAGDSVVSAIEVLPGTRLGRLSLRLCFGSTDRRGISLLGSLRGTLRGSEQP
jgi:hypothetical protein